MWQALRDIVNSAKESLGIEVPAVPDAGAVTDAVSGAGEQAGAAAGAATEAATDAVAGAGEQLAGRVSDLLDRFGG